MKQRDRLADLLRPTTPAHEAARVVLRARLRPLPDLAGRAASRSKNAPEHVHQLRVATRRAATALDIFADFVAPSAAAKVRKRLRRLRRAAAVARDIDVAAASLRALRAELAGPERAAADAVLDHLAARRRDARRAIRKAAKRDNERKLRRDRRRLLRSIPADPSGRTLQDVLAAATTVVLAEARVAGAADLADLANLHTLRIRIKRLRYTMELVEACGSAASTGAVKRLTALQDRLGALNDVAYLAGLLADARAVLLPAGMGGDGPTRGDEADLALGLDALASRIRARLADLHGDFIRDWSGGQIAALTDDLAPDASRPSPSGMPAPAADPRSNGLRRASPSRPLEPADLPRDPRRIAAIDVGTNSIRLIIAEMESDTELGEYGGRLGGGVGYRVLDDEKEVARLGRGLETTGRMDPGAMEAAATVVAQMRGIADGYGVSKLRVVGTACVRDASNGRDFVRLIRERAGLEMEVISAEEEARLAFLSASHAFDLGAGPAAVVDIGGGSTEVILAASGVLDRIYTIPLGAVRLTERFGGAEVAAGENFNAMKAAIRREFKERIGKAPFVPAVLIGTGGTFAALGNIALHAELGPAVDGLFSGSVQGYEVRRWEVRHLLDYLRKLSPRERERVGGLSADRADIIVAGLAIVEGLMRHLRVNIARVHEGGIRDGLLLQMVGVGARAGGAGGGGGGRDPLRSVLRFARACGYEHRHCNHVASLATQVFDGLAALPGVAAAHAGLFTPRNRLLLEAAAIVHDVGYLVNYAGHHKHSYHLIAHADLPGLTPREIEIIANVARYHRRSEPKVDHPNFARLSEADRYTVTALAAILRLADGLDRTHMQRIRTVRLAAAGAGAAAPGTVRLILESDREPTVDIWGATRKAALFERTFSLTPTYEWLPLPASASTSPDAEAASEVGSS